MNNFNLGQHPITSREQEVLHLIAHEHSSKEIASKLYVSHETVNSHRRNMMDKLGVRNTAGLIRVAFERGLMRVGQVAFILILFFATSARAQVSNDDINYEIVIKTLSWFASNSHGGESPDPTYLFKYRTSSSYSNIECDEDNYNGAPNNDWAIHYSDQVGPVLEVNKTILSGQGVSKTTTGYWSYFSFDSDTPGDPLIYAFGDDVMNCNDGSIPVTQNEPNAQNLIDESNSNTQVIFFNTWRYEFGNYYGNNGSLDFGTINSSSASVSLSHTNSNRAAPSGSSATLGYTNQYGSGSQGEPGDTGQSSPDVWYSFTIPSGSKARRVVLSTENGTRSYDTYIHLVRRNSFGGLNHVKSNDDIVSGNQASKITQDLCEGTYYVIVEGYQAKTGSFQLTLNATFAPTVAITAGTIISANSNTNLCSTNNIPGINNAASSTHSIYNAGSLEYKWQTKVGGQSFGDGNLSAEKGPSLSSSSTGVMGTEPVSFRRRAVVCGIEGPWSNVVTFNLQASTSIAGDIAYFQDDQYTREGYYTHFTFTGNSAQIIELPIIDPSPATIRWVKKVGNSDWDTIRNSSTNAYASDYTLGTVFELGKITANTLVKSVVFNGCNVADDSNTIEIEAVKADGSISGIVSAPPAGSMFGVRDVKVCAYPINTTLFGVKTECDSTDSDGKYIIDNLYYGKEEISYEVIPTYPGHDIHVTDINSDTTKVIALKASTKNTQGVNFADFTPFTLTGNIYQEFQSSQYGKQGVVIKLNGIARDTSDENGNYNLIIPSTGSYNIEPEYIDASGNTTPAAKHTFEPVSRDIFINDHMSDIDFENTSKSRLKITVAGNCEGLPTYLGTVNLQISDSEKVNGALSSFVKDIRTADQTGVFNQELPARNYTIKIRAAGTELQNRPSPFPYAEVTNVQNQLEGLEEINVDLRYAGDTSEVFYRPPIKLHLDDSGISTITTCAVKNNALQGLKFLKRGEDVPSFKITVYEGPIANGCKIDTGYVVINDVIADNSGTLPISKGEVLNSAGKPYALKAGYPNIGGDHLKTSTYTAYTLAGDNQDVKNLIVVVEGEKPRDKSFVTVTPQIPLLILHDPPTDRGYSWVDETTEMDIGFKSYTNKGKDYSKWVAAKVGFESTTEVGLGVSIGTGNKIWGTATGDIGGERTNTMIDETRVKLSTTKTYKTSETEIGSDADVFIGAAFNMIYANTDRIIVDTDTCMIINDVFMTIEPDNIATTFHLSTGDIKREIKRMKNIIEANPDSTKFFEEQIETWENTIADNEKYRQDVIAAGDTKDKVGNTTLGGQIDITASVKYDSTFINTHEFRLDVDKGVAAEVGFEIAGAGLSGGSYINFKLETITTNDTTETKSFESGYRLFDDDANDKFTIDIYNDARYNTPFFNTIASATSCPWEGAPDEPGEVPMEKVDDFSVQFKTGFPSSVIDVPVDQPAQFKFIITNLSKIYASSYRVNFDPKYNLEGALIEISGGNGAATTRFLDVPPEGEVEVNVFVRHPGAQTFSFNDLRFIFSTECNFEADNYGDRITQQVKSLSVTYLSECSPIRIDAPIGRTVNISNNNMIQVVMKDYIKTKIDKVDLEYAKKGSGVWRNSNISLTGAELNVNATVDGTGVFWDLSEILDDGEYEIRLKTVCNGIINYSKLEVVIIDRTKPGVFGSPSPLDDIYDFNMGDVVGVSYDELITCDNATALIIDIIEKDTLQVSPTSISCYENILDIIPPIFDGRSPSVYRVILNGIEDKARNSADEYKWVFVVGDFDFSEVACLPELNLVNNNLDQNAISVSAYRAIKIITDGEVPDFGETKFTAQQDITFSKGFSVMKGGGLLAEIEDCDAPQTCDMITSPEGLANAPDDFIRFEIIENESCIEAVFFEDNDQTNDVVVEVNDYVVVNNPSQVNVTVTFNKPLEAGTETRDIVLTNTGADSEVNLGTYDAINGSKFNLKVIVNYKDIVENTVTNYLVSARVVMTSL